MGESTKGALKKRLLLFYYVPSGKRKRIKTLRMEKYWIWNASGEKVSKPSNKVLTTEVPEKKSFV